MYCTLSILSKLNRLEGLPPGRRLVLLLARTSLLWILVVSLAAAAVCLLAPAFRLAFFSGLLIALATALIESMETPNEFLEQQFSVLLERIRLRSEPRPVGDATRDAERWHESGPWNADRSSLGPFRNLRWRCAVFGGVNLFTREKVAFRGARMRFVTRCYLCGDHSLVRLLGVFRCRLVTERRVPDFRQAAVPERSPGRRNPGNPPPPRS